MPSDSHSKSEGWKGREKQGRFTVEKPDRHINQLTKNNINADKLCCIDIYSWCDVIKNGTLPLPKSQNYILIMKNTSRQISLEGHPTKTPVCSWLQSCPTLATPRTIAHQAPLSMGFSRRKYWSGLPCPPPEDLPDPEIKLTSPAFTVWATRETLTSTQKSSRSSKPGKV